jgi:hypothetical protein
MIRFEGNCTASVVRQAKYRLKRDGSGFKVEVIIETPAGERFYPASRAHPDLAKMVNAVKSAAGGGEAGQFYINEHRQVIVPAGNPVEYYLAGEYPHDIILELGGTQFSGRPLDDNGALLKPGDRWSGRPRPGIKYTLKAGGADVEYEREITPGRSRVVRLSKVVSPADARQTARKIAAVKGNKGGPFYVNEFRALFGPVTDAAGLDYLFIGVLAETDPWFPKWLPPPGAPGPAPAPPPVPPPAASAAESPEASPALSLLPPGPEAKMIEIEDGSRGFTYESLFAPYLRGATRITVEDPYIAKPYQVANLLRFCEMCVRLGSIRHIVLVTYKMPDEAYAQAISVKKSLAGFGIALEMKVDPAMHDRRISTDHGWDIHPGRGLDLYKRPEDFYSVGASDFELRPCFKTRIIFQRIPASKAVASDVSG